MHVYVLSDSQLIAIFTAYALLTWFSARAWTLRSVRKVEEVSRHRSTPSSDRIQAENTELRSIVERQETRLRSLEVIATDPAQRTAKEIEELR